MRDVDLSPSIQSPPSPPPLSSHSRHGSNFGMSYYGFVVVGTAAVVLALYSDIFIRWCKERRERATVGRRDNNLLAMRASSSRSNLLSSFKYRKENDELGGRERGGSVDECVVCLSAFEEGEEVRRMPRCNHSFHADCIDMWLKSHSDCPLCRTVIHSPPLSPMYPRQTVAESQENDPDVLLDTSTPV